MICTFVIGAPGLSVWNGLYMQQTAIKQFSSWRHNNMWSLSDIGCLRDFNICSKWHFSMSNTVFNIFTYTPLYLYRRAWTQTSVFITTLCLPFFCVYFFSFSGHRGAHCICAEWHQHQCQRHAEDDSAAPGGSAQPQGGGRAPAEVRSRHRLPQQVPQDAFGHRHGYQQHWSWWYCYRWLDGGMDGGETLWGRERQTDRVERNTGKGQRWIRCQSETDGWRVGRQGWMKTERERGGKRHHEDDEGRERMKGRRNWWQGKIDIEGQATERGKEGWGMQGGGQKRRDESSRVSSVSQTPNTLLRGY